MSTYETMAILMMVLHIVVDLIIALNSEKK